MLPPTVRVFVALQPADLRRGFDGLAALAEEVLRCDPLSGHLFVFWNRRRDRVKILFWDVDGFCIWYKRLEVGVFQLPEAVEGAHGVEMSCSQLNRLLGGLDLKNGRRRRRYRRGLR